MQGLTAVMDRRGELTVAWVDQATHGGPNGHHYEPDDSGRIMAARVAADGTVAQPAAAPPDGWSAIALDGAGHQLVERLERGSTPSAAAVGVRPASGGPVEQAPLTEGPSFWRASPVAPTGSAIAAARWDRSSLQISVWRPPR